MEKYLIITGLLFNSAVISFNRLIRSFHTGCIVPA